jgi:hypothetical protein
MWKRLAMVAARVTCAGICVYILFFALATYTGNSDWMTEEGLLFDVMLVSFPSPAVLVAVISKIASDISPYHTLTSYSEMGYGIAGYRSLS